MPTNSRHFPNELKADAPSKLKYHEELLASLSRLNTYNPPVHTCSTGWSFSGLYKGPTSITYLFFRLSQQYPDLQFKSQLFLEWAEDYLKLSEVHASRPSAVNSDHCGIANETLAYLAVTSVINNDASLAQKLCKYEPVINADASGSNEWLYGRAGYLYLLRLCRTHFASHRHVVRALDDVLLRTIERIMKTPLPWTWHGKQYLGAAHGYVGIVAQLVLSASVLEPGAVDFTPVEELVSSLLDLQFESGNFPSSTDTPINSARSEDESAQSDRLVQFCHGGPGFVTSLEFVKKYFSQKLQQRIDKALEKAGQDTWMRGLLTKTPCLCHGMASNAFAFTDPNDKRFDCFLSCMVTERLESENKHHVGKAWLNDAGGSDSFAGLFTGEAGRAWAWAVADKSLQRTIIGFNDV